MALIVMFGYLDVMSHGHNFFTGYFKKLNPKTFSKPFGATEELFTQKNYKT